MTVNDALKSEKYYTYEEWLEIDGSDRTELINGMIRLMASPTPQHQAISVEALRQIANFLLRKPCRAYAALDVRLHENEDTVFQPDIMVVCDQSKISKKGCEGAPDFIAEIISPSTESHDKVTKYKAYRRAGVPEYWIIEPNSKIITAFRLIDGKYIADVYSESDTAPIQTLQGCEIDLSLLFQDS